MSKFSENSNVIIGLLTLNTIQFKYPRKRRSMNWYFQDSKGIQGPLTEPQLRTILATQFEQSATVRSEKSNWVLAVVAREKFERLDNEGVYLRCNDMVFGPFVASRADELRGQKPNYFDSQKVGKEGKWKTIEDLDVKTERPEIIPPPIVRQLQPPLPQLDRPTTKGINETASSEPHLDPFTSVAPLLNNRRKKRKSRSVLSSLRWAVLFPVLLWGFYFLTFHTNLLNRLPISVSPFQFASHEVGVESLLFEFKLSDVEPANGTGYHLLAEVVTNVSIGDLPYGTNEVVLRRAHKIDRDIHRLELGTKVLHLKAAIMLDRYVLQYVRILSGPLAGKEGWVLDSHLKANW